MGLAAEVLPVVSIHALISHVAFVLVVERTPDCLEMEKVEVCVLLHLVKHIDAKLFFAVGKRTKLPKLTFICLIWVGLAELSFVLFRVVKLLDSIV